VHLIVHLVHLVIYLLHFTRLVGLLWLRAVVAELAAISVKPAFASGDVLQLSQGGGDFEADQTELRIGLVSRGSRARWSETHSHFGTAWFRFRQIRHFGIEIAVVEIARELRVGNGVDDAWIAAVIFAGAGVENDGLPPYPPPHFHLERREVAVMASVAVETQRMRHPNDQAGQSPDDPCIVVPSQTHQEQDECLEDDDFVRLEEVGPGQCLFYTESVACEKIAFFFAKLCFAFVGPQARDGTVVDRKHERFVAPGKFVEMGGGFEDGLLRRWDMYDFYQGVDVLFENIPVY
jgi:hypothetical protein